MKVSNQKTCFLSEELTRLFLDRATSCVFGCLGLTHEAGTGVWRWTSASGKARVTGRPSWWCAHVGFPSVHGTSLSKSGKLNSGSDCGLSLEVLGRADVISRVNGLKVFHRHDALGEPGDVAPASVDQPPGVMDRHGPFILCNDTRRDEARGTRDYKQAPATQHGAMLRKHWSVRPWALPHCHHFQRHVFQSTGWDFITLFDSICPFL